MKRNSVNNAQHKTARNANLNPNVQNASMATEYLVENALDAIQNVKHAHHGVLAHHALIITMNLINIQAVQLNVQHVHSTA